MKRKLQIFVSSIYIDLLEERQAAVEAILKFGNIPSGIELFTAGNESQLQAMDCTPKTVNVFFKNPLFFLTSKGLS